MAYNVPTATVAGQTVWYLSQLPSYEEFVSFAQSAEFQNKLGNFLSSALASQEVSPSFEGINQFHQSLFANTLNVLPAGSAVYTYITLKADFRSLQEHVLQRETSFEASEMTDMLLNSTASLYHPDIFHSAISYKEDDFRRCNGIFEFVSLLENLYLTRVIDNISKSDYLTRVVTAEINRYNAMVAIRRGQRGEEGETINQYLITDKRLVRRVLIETLTTGDILGKIGNQLGLKPETLSETSVETYLTHEEIRALNSARYEGVDAERIIQYLEVVSYFLSNVKLALAGHMFDLPFEDVRQRFINYAA